MAALYPEDYYASRNSFVRLTGYFIALLVGNFLSTYLWVFTGLYLANNSYEPYEDGVSYIHNLNVQYNFSDTGTELYLRANFVQFSRHFTLLPGTFAEILSNFLTIFGLLNVLLYLLFSAQFVSMLVLEGLYSPSWETRASHLLAIVSRHPTVAPDVYERLEEFLTEQREKPTDILSKLSSSLPQSLLSNIGADLSSSQLISLNLFPSRTKLALEYRQFSALLRKRFYLPGSYL